MPGGVDWRFPAILIAAMLLGLGLTYIQMRSYNAELNKALKTAKGEHLMLVSGRGRSFRGGALVILIVNTLTRQIVYARAMVGATVFVRFRDVPKLLGPMEGAADRILGKQFRAAVDMALNQVKPAPPPHSPADPSTPAPPVVDPQPAEDQGARTMRRRIPRIHFESDNPERNN